MAVVSTSYLLGLYHFRSTQMVAPPPIQPAGLPQNTWMKPKVTPLAAESPKLEPRMCRYCSV